MAEINIKKLDESVKKAFKMRCVMDGRTQSSVLKNLMKQYSQGRISYDVKIEQSEYNAKV